MPKIMDKVRKLLAKAERAATTEEAEAYTAKANELMLRHHIDLALLAAEEHVDDVVDSKTFTLVGYAKPKAHLLTEIADAFGAQAIRVSAHGQTNVMVVYGWRSDLEMIDVLFASLLVQAQREAARERKRHPGVHGRSFMTSFLVGYSIVVGKRLRELKRKATAAVVPTTIGTEVALINRDLAVARAFRRDHPHTVSAGRSRTSSAAGFYSGRDAGNRADLGQSRLGGSRVALETAS